MEFLPRYTPKEPVDIAAVHSDDALIEMLRAYQVPTRPKHIAPDLPVELPPTDDDAADDLFSVSQPRPRVSRPQVPNPESSTPEGRHRSAAEAAAGSNADTNDALTALLQAWQAEITAAPLPEPLSITDAVAIVRAAPPARRSFKPVMAIAAAIFALLMGSAAVGSRSAAPGDLLWPVTQLLWSDRADSVIAGQTAREGIDTASAAMMAGHPEEAVDALEVVTVVITKVQEQDGRETLESDYQRVSAELESMTTQTSSSSTTPSTQGTAQTNGPAPATSVVAPQLTTVPPSPTGVPSVPPSSGVPTTPSTPPTTTTSVVTSDPPPSTNTEPTDPPQSTPETTPTPTEPSDQVTTSTDATTLDSPGAADQNASADTTE